jgi:hypothetical protein
MTKPMINRVYPMRIMIVFGSLPKVRTFWKRLKPHIIVKDNDTLKTIRKTLVTVILGG